MTPPWHPVATWGRSLVDGLPTAPAALPGLPGSIELGAFSISLNVADLAASRAFSEKLGVEVTGGGTASCSLILTNGETPLGPVRWMVERTVRTVTSAPVRSPRRTSSASSARPSRSAGDHAVLDVTLRAEPMARITGLDRCGLIGPDPDRLNLTG